MTPIKNCRKAAYSPLGDKLIIATGSIFMILDSYTMRTLNQVYLPNLSLQSSMTNNQLFEPKKINDFKFISNDSFIVLSGYNTLTEIKNIEKTLHFGFL